MNNHIQNRILLKIHTPFYSNILSVYVRGCSIISGKDNLISENLFLCAHYVEGFATSHFNTNPSENFISDLVVCVIARSMPPSLGASTYYRMQMRLVNIPCARARSSYTVTVAVTSVCLISSNGALLLTYLPNSTLARPTSPCLTTRHSTTKLSHSETQVSYIYIMHSFPTYFQPKYVLVSQSYLINLLN